VETPTPERALALAPTEAAPVVRIAREPSEPRIAKPVATTKSNRTLAIALFAAPIVIAVIALAVWLAMRSPPTRTVERPPEHPTSTHRTPTPEQRTNTTPQRIGPGPDERLEGSDADFDLAALGIEPSTHRMERRERSAASARLIKAANTARQLRQRQAAEEQYKEALAIDPRNPRATAGLTWIAMDRHDGPRAVMLAQRLVRLRPRHPNNYTLLGDALLMAGNRDAARRAFEKALEFDPHFGPARQRLGRLE
jgi:tetratricopeptide (TPR) repeat protein